LADTGGAGAPSPPGITAGAAPAGGATSFAGEAGAAALGASGASGSTSSFAGSAFFTTPPAGVSGTSNSFFGSPPVANASFGLLAIAAFMNSIHIGNAAFAPVSFDPSVSAGLSNPIHVPQVTEGENPINHASVKSFVVPVLPPSGCFI
jgi:hypothetical protein